MRSGPLILFAGAVISVVGGYLSHVGTKLSEATAHVFAQAPDAAAAVSGSDLGAAGLLTALGGLVMTVLGFLKTQKEMELKYQSEREERQYREKRTQEKLDEALAERDKLQKRLDEMEQRTIPAHSTRIAANEGKVAGLVARLEETGTFDDQPGIPPGVPATLLLVEDAADAARLLADFFTRKGCEVTPAPTVADAIKEIEKGPAWCYLDLSLPDGSGLEVMRHAREKGVGTRFLIVTGELPSAEIRAQIDQLKPEKVLFKPIYPGVILDIIASSHRKDERMDANND